MKITDLKREYGSVYRFMKETGLSEGNFAYWRKKGYIPINTQIKIEKLTNGRLKADLSHCLQGDI